MKQSNQTCNIFNMAVVTDDSKSKKHVAAMVAVLKNVVIATSLK